MAAGTSLRARAAGGIVGPLVFTAAWVFATLREADYSVAVEHISGLAAPDARHPRVMTTGFLTLGGGTVAFASALEEALGGRARAGYGPALVRFAGWATVAAGLLRRDQLRLGVPAGCERQSWRNDGHDAAAAGAYVCLLAAPLALAARVVDEPQLRHLRRPARVAAAVTGGLLGAFATGVVEPYNGIVQRVAVSIPLAGMAATAGILLRGDRVNRRAGPPRRAG